MELSNTDTTLKITENNKEDIMEKETSIEPVTTKIKSLKLKLKGPKTKLRIKSKKQKNNKKILYPNKSTAVTFDSTIFEESPQYGQIARRELNLYRQ